MSVATYERAFTALESKGFPSLPQWSKDAIEASEQSEFLIAVDHLDEAGPDTPKYLTARDYLASVISAVTPKAVRTIGEIYGPARIPLEQLIQISKEEGRAFRSALSRIAEDVTEATHELEYLKQCIVSATGVTPLNIDRQSPVTFPSHVANEKLESHNSQAAIVVNEPTIAQVPKPQYRTLHIYAGSAAICVSDDTIRGSKLPTLRIEVAKSLNTDRYDWNAKQTFQCTPGELVLIYGVLLGLIVKVSLAGHGQENEKSLQLEKQENKYYLKMCSGRHNGAGVPITAMDSFLLMMTIYRRLQEINPQIPASVLDLMICTVCRNYQTRDSNADK